MQNKQSNANRNHGIDLLRVILSFCVVTIHVLYYGGFRTYGNLTHSSFFPLSIIGIAMICTVNCFAIISGYVLYDQDIRYTNILRLFFAVLYHGLLITAAFAIFFPQVVDKENWLQAFFPVSQREFWYFTSYFGAFFFIPLLINGMRTLSKKQAELLIFFMIVVFSFIPTITRKDPFNLEQGYSVIWLLVMFVIGTYLKKYRHHIRLKKPALICIFVGCIIITTLAMIVSIYKPSLGSMQLLEYTSPTIVFAAIAVVLIFSSLSVPNSIKKISNYCIFSTFSIYILHEHPLIRQNIIRDKFVPILDLPALLQILVVFGIAFFIWFACLLLDYLRQYIFRLLKIDISLQKLERILTSPKEYKKNKN